MPLAISAALLMLLGSLSVQSAVLQSRLAQTDREALARQEDAAVSAAQQLAAVINQRHSCLLPLALEHWQLQGTACSTASEQDAVRQGEQGGTRWQLLAWRPGPDRVEALIAVQPAPGTPARRASFSLAVLADPPRLAGLRLTGWRGVAP